MLKRLPPPLRLVLLLSVLCALVFVVVVARHGMGYSFDSIYYFRMAEGLSEFRGIVALYEGRHLTVTHFAPGYPGALLPLVWLGFSPQNAAFVVQSLCLLLLCALSGWTVWRYSQQRLPALLTVLVCGLGFWYWHLHRFAMSEPLFLVFLTAGFMLFPAYQKQPTLRNSYLLGLLLSAVFLTRFAGAAGVVAFGLAVLWTHPSWSSRIRHGAYYALGFFTLGAPYLLRNTLILGKPFNRETNLRIPPLHKFEELLRSCHQLFWPAPLETLHPRDQPYLPLTAFHLTVGLLGGAALLYLAVQIWRSRLPEMRLRVLFTVLYMGLLLYTISGPDWGTPLDERLLGVLVVVLIPGAVLVLAQRPVPAWRKVLHGGLALGLLLGNWLGGAKAIEEVWRRSSGFNTPFFQNHPLMEEVQNLPPDALLLAKWPDMDFLAHFTGRTLYGFRDRRLPDTLRQPFYYVEFYPDLHDDLTPSVSSCWPSTASTRFGPTTSGMPFPNPYPWTPQQQTPAPTERCGPLLVSGPGSESAF